MLTKSAVVIVALFVAGCEPPCAKGHYVTRDMGSSFWNGNSYYHVPMLVPITTAEHDDQDFYCDLYQAGAGPEAQ